MSSELISYLVRAFFGSSLIFVIYMIYHQFMLAKIDAENSNLKLGEEENAQTVNSQSDIDLIDAINKELPVSDPNSRK
jgi:hypothetical protein